MTGTQAVITRESLSYKPATQWEMNSGAKYARKKYKQAIDPLMVGLFVDTTLQRRNDKERGKPLAWIAALVIRERVPPTDKRQEALYVALKGAVMKVMNFRSQAKKRRDKLRRESGLPVRSVPPERGHVEDPRRKGQLLLI